MAPLADRPLLRARHCVHIATTHVVGDAQHWRAVRAIADRNEHVVARLTRVERVGAVDHTTPRVETVEAGPHSEREVAVEVDGRGECQVAARKAQSRCVLVVSVRHKRETVGRCGRR